MPRDGSLILRRAALSRKSGEWSDDDYDVFDGERCVGRIFFDANRTWYWGLANVNGAKNRGNLATLADAKAAFRAAYEAWLTDGFTDTVLITLGVDAQTGEIDRDAPFMVNSDRPGACFNRPYIDEPHVIDQMLPGEHQARFRAKWNDASGDWVFGQRVADA